MDIIISISIYCAKVSKTIPHLYLVHMKVSTPKYYELPLFHHTTSTVIPCCMLVHCHFVLLYRFSQMLLFINTT